MNYTQSIELDLSCGAPPVIQAKQGDDGARIVKITLLSNGVAYAPPAGATARFRALKPDGYSVDNPAALSAGVVTVELTAQALAVPGTVKADVVLTDSDGDILSTGTFHIIVEPAPVGKDLNSTNEVLTLQALIRQSQGLGSGGSGAASNVPAYVSAEAERVATAVQARQNANTISFIACSDLHHSTVHANAAYMTAGLTHMGQAMALIRERVHIDFAVMLGDMTWDGGETEEEALEAIRFVNSCLYDGFADLPIFRTRGNHEDGYGSGIGFSAAEIFRNIGIYNTGAVFGNRTAGYCCRDFEDVKLRVICLNSSDGGGCQLSSAQVEWLTSVLAVPDGWQSILLSHHPLDWGKDGGASPIDALNGATGLLATFHGHIHNYKVGTVTGTAVPRIAIPNACCGRENEYDTAYGITWGEDTKYPKTAFSATDTAFCVVTIDLTKKVIYADHYGAGYDRVITADGSVAVKHSVTNVLTNVTTNNSTASVESGASYEATLTVADGCELSSVSVTMGGTDITASAYSSGVVSITEVRGNVVITAVAVVPDSGEGEDGGGEDSGETGVYTNLVPTAVATDGETVFNGTGYMDGTYASSSGTNSHYGPDAACVTTGFIWLDSNVKEIYVKGATWDTTNAHCRMNVFSDGNLGTNSSAQEIKATVSQTLVGTETLGEKYYKFTIKDSANMTGRWYCMSLVGTGADLIITHDEPID